MDYGDGDQRQTRDTYGCMAASQVRERGPSCGLGYTLALSVTHSADATAVCGLWHYISVMPLPLPVCLLPSAWRRQLYMQTEWRRCHPVNWHRGELPQIGVLARTRNCHWRRINATALSWKRVFKAAVRSERYNDKLCVVDDLFRSFDLSAVQRRK